MDRRSTRSVLAGAAGVALASGGAIGVGLAAWIARLNGWSFGGDAALIAVYLGALYTGVIGCGLVGSALFLLALGGRPGPRVFFGLALAFCLLLTGALRYVPSVQLLSVVPHMTAIGALDIAVLLAAALLIGIGVARASPRPLAGLVASALALLIGLEMVHRAHERPLYRDLTRVVPEVLAGTAPVWPPPAAEPFENAKLVVLGFDGLSWEVLIPLLRRGELPNFHALISRAAYGHLETLPFAISPVVWEVIATGQPEARHGIGYHSHFEFRGVSRRVRRLPHFRLTNSPMALRRALARASVLAPWKQVPANSTDARVARLWEVADHAGLSVGIYDWMNTSPVAPVLGFVHGYGPIPPRMFPPGLDDDLPALPSGGAPGADGERWVTDSLPRERANYRRFRTLAQRFRPELLMFYTHLADAANHLSWKDATFGNRIFFAGIEHPDVEPGAAIVAATRFLDDLLGDILARLPDRAALAIVSDHGFDFRGYEHDNGPPGVFILAGPGVRTGLTEGASVFDMAPTWLHLLGLAVADDMRGTPLAIASPGGPLDRPVERVASYGPAATPLAGGVASEADLEEREQYLRALGYVN